MDKIVLITGASSDLGISFIQENIAEYAKVVAHYNHKNEAFEALLDAHKDKILPMQVDFSKREEVERLVQELKEEKLTLTHIVHLVSLPAKSIRFHKSEVDEYEAMMRVSFYSIVEILKAFIPAMQKQKFGRILFMLSAYTTIPDPWAAIGAGVIKVAKDIVNASNNMGDMMAVKARQVEAVWQTVLTSISAGFSNLLARAESSARAAKALQEMEDAEFEMLNSVSLQRAEMEAELVKLEIESRDATKSYEQRAAAAEKYLTMVEKLYRIEMNYYQDLARQSAATWLDSASTPKGAILGNSEGNVAALYRFLKEYGEDNALQKAVANYRKAWKEAGELWDRTQSGKEALRWVNENRQDWDQTNYRRFALDLGYSYEEQKNDELNGTKLVDNIKKAYDAVARYDRETKKMQNNLNSLSAQIGNIDLSGSVDIDLSKVTSAHEIASKTGQQIAKDLRTLEAEFSEIEDLDIDMSDIENEMNLLTSSQESFQRLH